MNRWQVVLLFAVAACLLAAGSGASTTPPIKDTMPSYGSGLGGPGAAAPGSIVTFDYDVAGKKVEILFATVKLPKQFKLISDKQKTTPYVIVKGRPTWVIKRIVKPLTPGKGFHFSVRVSKSAKVGSKFYVVVNESAMNRGMKWSHKGSIRVPMRIAHPGV